MNDTFSKQWFRWLTPLWLLLVLGMAGCSSGKLGSDSTDTTETGDTDGGTSTEALPATPTVADLEMKLTEEAVILGGCTQSSGTAYQSDIIEVSVQGNTQTSTCVGTDPNAKWIVSFPVNTFSKGAATISVKAKTHSGKESEIGYGTLKVTDGQTPQPGPSVSLPAIPTINPLSILSTEKALITGTCIKSATSTNSDTDYVTVSVEGKSRLKALCLSDNTWSRDFGNFTPNLYTVSAKATKQGVGDSASSDALINVQSALVSVVTSPSSANLKSGESVTFIISFKDQEKNALSGNASIRFSSECLQSNNSKMLDGNVEKSVFASEDGTIVAVYKTDGCEGIDKVNVTGTFDGAAVTSSTPIVINIEKDNVSQIKWISSTPDRIVTQGANGQQIAEIIFELTGERSAKAPNKRVVFSIKASTGEPDLVLLNTEATSDGQGRVIVQVRSGYKPNNVTIDATYTDPNDSNKVVTGRSGSLSVASGLTTHGNLTLNLLRYSPLSYDRVSTAVKKLEVIATVKDRFAKPVIDGTIVTFQVESITRSNATTGSIGSFFNAEGTDTGKDAFCKTESGVCSILWGPDGDNHPEDGYVTIIAIAKGQENFLDANHNNIFDDGDLHVDKPEPYLDHRSYYASVYSKEEEDYIETLIPSDYIEGDYAVIDTNANETRDPKNGKFDGVNCKHTSLCADEETFVDVTAQVTFHQAAFNVTICQNFNQTGLMQVNTNGIINLSGLKFCDGRTGGALPTGTTIELSAKEGDLINTSQPIVHGNRKLPFTFGLSYKASSTATIGTVEAVVTVPGANTDGGGDLFRSFSWNIDITLPTAGWLVTAPTFDFGSVKYLKKGEALAIGGACSTSSTYNSSPLPMPTVKLRKDGDPAKVLINGDLVEELIECDQGSWSSLLDLRNEVGEITLTIASESDFTSVFLEGEKKYYSELKTAKVYVANTPDEAFVENIDPYLITDGQIVITGTCNSTNTTDVKVFLKDAGDETVACNVDRWRLPISADTYTVKTSAINSKEQFIFTDNRDVEGSDLIDHTLQYKTDSTSSETISVL